MVKGKVLGLCGVARCGKDSFADSAQFLLEEKGFKVKKFAFADELKRMMNPFLEKEFGISAFTQDDEEKKIIRPLLVGLGQSMRIKDPLYWVKEVEFKVLSSLKKDYFCIVTDVRYKNEIDWVHSLCGESLYIAREGTSPANEEEKVNNVFVKEHSKHNLFLKNFDKKSFEVSRYNITKNKLLEMGLWKTKI